MSRLHFFSRGYTLARGMRGKSHFDMAAWIIDAVCGNLCFAW